MHGELVIEFNAEAVIGRMIVAEVKTRDLRNILRDLRLLLVHSDGIRHMCGRREGPRDGGRLANGSETPANIGRGSRRRSRNAMYAHGSAERENAIMAFERFCKPAETTRNGAQAWRALDCIRGSGCLWPSGLLPKSKRDIRAAICGIGKCC